MIRWATFDRRQTTAKVRRLTIDSRLSVAESRIAAVGRRLSNVLQPTITETYQPDQTTVTVQVELEEDAATPQENAVATQETPATPQEIAATPQETPAPPQETALGTTDLVLALINEKPEISLAEIAEKLGISRDGVKYHIDRLKQSVGLIHDGPTKKGRWIVTNP